MHAVPRVRGIGTLTGERNVVVRFGKSDVIDGRPVEEDASGGDVYLLYNRIQVPAVGQTADGAQVELDMGVKTKCESQIEFTGIGLYAVTRAVLLAGCTILNSCKSVPMGLTAETFFTISYAEFIMTATPFPIPVCGAFAAKPLPTHMVRYC